MSITANHPLHCWKTWIYIQKPYYAICPWMGITKDKKKLQNQKRRRFLSSPYVESSRLPSLGKHSSCKLWPFLHSRVLNPNSIPLGSLNRSPLCMTYECSFIIEFSNRKSYLRNRLTDSQNRKLIRKNWKTDPRAFALAKDHSLGWIGFWNLHNFCISLS